MIRITFRRTARPTSPKFLIILILLTLSSAHAGAEPMYPNPLLDVGSEPVSIAVGDFDENGVQDLAVANLFSDDISILLGLGDGRFSPERRFAAFRPSFISVGEFDGDGHQDLVIVSGDNSRTVHIFTGAGDGTFLSSGLCCTIVSSPTSTLVHDFNTDGIDDLAVTGSRSVTIHMGQGDGTFQFSAGVGADSGGLRLAAGDFDSDGNSDLAITNSRTDEIIVALGLGDGTFGSKHHFPTGDSPARAGVGDVNGDGFQDIVVANFSSNDVSVLMGHGDGTFLAQRRFSVGGGPTSIALGLFNEDAFPDLAVANNSPSGSVAILFGLGDGTFTAETRFEAGLTSRSIVVADFDADGRADLACADTNSDTVSLLFGLDGGAFGPQIRVPVGDTPVSAAIGDLNMDGHQDIVVANIRSDSISILLGQGDGSFAPHMQLEDGLGPIAVQIADFNDDGFGDLAVANFHSNDISIFLNSEGHSFLPQSRMDTGSFPGFIAIGDFNSDGLEDLAITNQGSGPTNGLSIFIGEKDGTFRSRIDYETGVRPSSVAIGDFNEDGVEDLAVTNIGTGFDGNISILIGKRNGTFGPQSQIGIVRSVSTIAVVDVNGDTHHDLVFTNGPHSGVVSIIPGFGDGTFGGQSALIEGRGDASHVMIQDFDADGLRDIAASIGELNYLMIFRGLSEGGFHPPELYRTGFFPRSLAAGDLNADGGLDLIATNAVSDDVWILLNQNATAVEPMECLELRNRGQCVNCCKANLGCAPLGQDCKGARACTRLCMTLRPPGHGQVGEPLP